MALRKIATRISGGIIRMDAEAQTSAHGTSTPMAANAATATGRVNFSCMRINAKKNSFHNIMKVNVMVDIRAGITLGRVIL